MEDLVAAGISHFMESFAAGQKARKRNPQVNAKEAAPQPEMARA